MVEYPRLPEAPVGYQRLRGYRRQSLLPDVAAGLLVAALALPQALAYAGLAGVPVQVGLYTLPPALLAYALWGSSWLLFMGPISTVSVLSGSIVGRLSHGDPETATAMTAALAVIAGLILVIAGLAKVGWVAGFLSEPIITGFVAGLVLLIVVGEIPSLLGITAPSGAVFDRLWFLITHIRQAHWASLAVGAVALGLLFGGSRLLPKVPWGLLVLLAGVVVSSLLDLAARGVAVVGAVPGGLPVPSLPEIDTGQLGGLLIGGASIAMVGLAEGLAAARIVGRPGEQLRDDTELIANGAADIASGVFGGMAVGGSLSKTAANARAGARTQMSGIFAAITVLVVLVFATGLLSALPRAVLSAVVVHSVWNLVHPSAFRRYRMVRRNDFVASLVALGGVLLLGPLNGMLVAVVQSLLGLIYRMSQPRVHELGKVPGEKGSWGALSHDPRRRRTTRRVIVVRPSEPVFWVNVDPVLGRVRDLTRERRGVRMIVLDLEATSQMDTTTADRLREYAVQLHDQGLGLFLATVQTPVRDVLAKAGVIELLGPNRVFRSVQAAVREAKQTYRAQRAAAKSALPAQGTAPTKSTAPPEGAVPAPDGAGDQMGSISG